MKQQTIISNFQPVGLQDSYYRCINGIADKMEKREDSVVWKGYVRAQQEEGLVHILNVSAKDD